MQFKTDFWDILILRSKNRFKPLFNRKLLSVFEFDVEAVSKQIC